MGDIFSWTSCVVGKNTDKLLNKRYCTLPQASERLHRLYIVKITHCKPQGWGQHYFTNAGQTASAKEMNPSSMLREGADAWGMQGTELLPGLRAFNRDQCASLPRLLSLLLVQILTCSKPLRKCPKLCSSTRTVPRGLETVERTLLVRLPQELELRQNQDPPGK